jgi:hypothetical protein
MHTHNHHPRESFEVNEEVAESGSEGTDDDALLVTTNFMIGLYWCRKATAFRRKIEKETYSASIRLLTTPVSRHRGIQPYRQFWKGFTAAKAKEQQRHYPSVGSPVSQGEDDGYSLQTVSPEKLELSTHDTDDAPVSRELPTSIKLFEDVSNNETVLNRTTKMKLP